MFKPIKQKRVYVEIVEQIKELINEGILKAGDRLISERELAEKLHVSRASIREAFSALYLMGILESRPGEGTFIRRVSTEEIINPLALVLALEKENNFEVMEVRKALEAESAYLAAERADESDLEKMRAYINLMEEDIHTRNTGEVSDAQFHYTIVESTQNKVLVKLMSTIYDLLVSTMQLSREKMFLKHGNHEKLLKQHKEIYEAIAARQPALSRKKMYEHLEFVSGEILSFSDVAELKDSLG